jgi:hypothetical protein
MGVNLTYAEYKRNQALSKVRVNRKFLLMMDSQQLFTYIFQHLRLLWSVYFFPLLGLLHDGKAQSWRVPDWLPDLCGLHPSRQRIPDSHPYKIRG